MLDDLTDTLSTLPGDAGEAARADFASAPLASETPADTSARLYTADNQRRQWGRVKAADLANRGIPSVTDTSGDTKPIQDQTGQALTSADPRNSIAYDSTGNAVSYAQKDPTTGKPILSDPYATAPKQTDKEGNIYTAPKGLPWRWEGIDPDIQAANKQEQEDKLNQQTNTALAPYESQAKQQATAAARVAKTSAKLTGATLAKAGVPLMDDEGEPLDIANGPNIKAHIDATFNKEYASEAANERPWFGPGQYTPAAQALRQNIDQRKALANSTVDNHITAVGAAQQANDQLSAIQTQRQTLEAQRLDRVNAKRQSAGMQPVSIPGLEHLQPGNNDQQEGAIPGVAATGAESTTEEPATIPGLEVAQPEISPEQAQVHQQVAAALPPSAQQAMQPANLDDKGEVKPEGFWATVGRAFGSKIIPSVATAVGGLGAGALAIESGPGAIAADVAAGAASGYATNKAQRAVMGDQWANQNDAQMEANAKEHPIAAQIGATVPFLVSLLGGQGWGALAKGITGAGKAAISEALQVGGKATLPLLERSLQLASLGARGGASEGVQQPGATPASVLDETARTAITNGALGLFPMAKTLISAAGLGKVVGDAGAMALAGGIYDSAIHGKPFDPEEIAKEAEGNIPAFLIQHALLTFMHSGMEGIKPEAKASETAPKGTIPGVPTPEGGLSPSEPSQDAIKAHQEEFPTAFKDILALTEQRKEQLEDIPTGHDAPAAKAEEGAIQAMQDAIRAHEEAAKGQKTGETESPTQEPAEADGALQPETQGKPTSVEFKEPPPVEAGETSPLTELLSKDKVSEMAKTAGVEYQGESEGLHAFKDPETSGNFSIKGADLSPATVTAARDKMREAFNESPIPGVGEATEADIDKAIAEAKQSITKPNEQQKPDESTTPTQEQPAGTQSPPSAGGKEPLRIGDRGVDEEQRAEAATGFTEKEIRDEVRGRTRKLRASDESHPDHDVMEVGEAKSISDTSGFSAGRDEKVGRMIVNFHPGAVADSAGIVSKNVKERYPELSDKDVKKQATRWVRAAHDEELIHIHQLVTAGKAHDVFYDKMWKEQIPQPMRAAYDNARNWKGERPETNAQKAAEFERMVIQYRKTGTISEALFGSESAEKRFEELKPFLGRQTPVVEANIARVLAKSAGHSEEASKESTPPETAPKSETPSTQQERGPPKNTFRRKIPEPAGGHDIIEDVLHEIGKITHPETARRDALRQEGKTVFNKTTERGGQYDQWMNMPAQLRGLVLAKIGANGVDPDAVAQNAFEHGFIRDPSADTLREALLSAWTTRIRNRAHERAQAKEQKGASATQKQQDKDFAKDSGEPSIGDVPIPAQEMNVGDVVEVGGQKLRVIDVDPDNGEVTLEDHSKYGIQHVKDGDFIYGEIEKSKEEGFDPEKSESSTLPTLRRGEKQGDLLSKQREDLTLAGESESPKLKAAREKQASAKAAEESKAKLDRDQRSLFASKPEYQGEHGSPDSESGAPLYDVTKNGVYPNDVYSNEGLRYYSTGEDEMDRHAFAMIRSFKGRPNAKISIYRAVPFIKTKEQKILELEKGKSYIQRFGQKKIQFKYDDLVSEIDRLRKSQTPEKIPITSINAGDWVAINRKYAKSHGEAALGGEAKIIKKTVRAKDIFTAGDSWLEWGYDPQPLHASKPAAGEAFYAEMADDVREDDSKQKATEPDAEQLAAIYDAYREEEKLARGMPGIKIADVMERAGYGKQTMQLGKQHLMWMWQHGLIISMPALDWSLSNNRTRAWGMHIMSNAAGHDTSLAMIIPKTIPGMETLHASKPEEFKADMREQSQWMDSQARAQGFENATELAQNDSKAFKKLGIQWRSFHERDAEGTFLQNEGVERINQALYGRSKTSIPGLEASHAGGRLAGTRDALGDALSVARGNERASGSAGKTPDRWQQGEALEKWARENGLLLEKLPAEFDPESPNNKGGLEHEVFEQAQARRWLKITRNAGVSMGRTPVAARGDQFEFDEATPLQYLQRLKDWNETMGDDIRLHGFLFDGKSIDAITSQPNIVGDFVKQSEINEAFYLSGYQRFQTGGFYRKRGNTAVFDVHEANAVKRDGVVIPFDGMVIHPNEEMKDEIEGQLFSQSVRDTRLSPEERAALNASKPDDGSVGASDSPRENLTREAEAAGVVLKIEELKGLTRGDPAVMGAVRAKIKARTGRDALFASKPVAGRLEELKEASGWNDLVTATQKLFSPDSVQTAEERKLFRGDPDAIAGARHTGMDLDGITAEMDRRKKQWEDTLKEARTLVSKLSDPLKLELMKRVDEGTPLKAGPYKAAIDQLAKIDAKRTQELKDWFTAMGRDDWQNYENFLKNIVPHYFKDQALAAKVTEQYIDQRKKMAGSGGFLKHREGFTMREIMDWAATQGITLEPKHTNVIDAVMDRWTQQERYRGAHTLMEAMVADGRGHWENTDYVPRGNNRKIANLIGRRHQDGRWQDFYADEPSAQIINNYLSRGLRDHKFIENYFIAANALNALQLGVSFFHAGFVTSEGMVSSFALGLQKLLSGDMAGLKDVLMAPFSTGSDIMLGRKIRKEMLHPGSMSPDMTAVVDAMVAGGYRDGVDSFYHDQHIKAFFDAIRGHKVFTGVLRAPLALIELIAKPIMEFYVPWMKGAAVYKLAQMHLKQSPGITATELHRRLQEDVRSGNSRFGQLTYDNLHLHKTVKDILMGMTRSLGWNFGSLAELGGGVYDWIKFAKNAAIWGARKIGGDGSGGKGGGPGGGDSEDDYQPGGKHFPRITNRQAYILALPIIIGLFGVVLSAMFGQKPKSLKDYFAIKTGEIDDHGNPVRVQLPSYVRDMVSYSKHPLQTLGNKLHPILAMLSQMLQNKDYFGVAIRNEGDPIVKQILEELGYIGKQVAPFSIRNAQKLTGSNASLPIKVAAAVGALQIAPASAGYTAAQEKANDLMREQIPSKARTQAQADHSALVSQLTGLSRVGKGGPAISAALASGKITPKDVEKIQKNASVSQLVATVNHLSLDDAKKVEAVSNPDERMQLRPVIAKKSERVGRPIYANF